MTVWNELRFNIGRFRRVGSRVGFGAAPSGDDRIDFDVTVAARDLAVSTARIPDGEPVRVQGHIAAGPSGLEAKGAVQSRWEGECRRCLEPVHGDIEIALSVSFGDDPDEEGELYPVDGDWVDVGEVVREELMLALPLSPLCSGECAGADPERFPTESAGGDAAPADDEPDPRWAALSQISFDED